MNSGRIEVGDLVQLVRACCQRSSAYLGWIAEAEQRVRYNFRCRTCHYEAPDIMCIVVRFTGHGPVPEAWLKRFPPLGELEEERRDTKVSA